MNERTMRLLRCVAVPMAAWLASCAAPSEPADSVAAAPPGPAGEVTIYRDKMGVPHVFADSGPAVFYGVGYALAQDRLAVAELEIRAANGRLAELLGPAAVDGDKGARLSFATEDELKAQFAALSPEYQAFATASYQGWLERVRAVRRDPSQIPYEFKEWGSEPTEFTFWEYLNTKVAGTRNFGSSGGNELTNLAFYRELVAKFGEAKAKTIFDDVLPLQDRGAVSFIPTSDESTVASLAPALFNPQASLAPTLFDAQASLPLERLGPMAQPPERVGASRAFLIGAKKSASGNTMILQATADGPDVHLSGGGFDAAGYSSASGGGTVYQGRTPYFAWSITTGEADMVDVFAEKLNPENPRQYFHDGGWRDMTVREETIKVKGGAPVTFTVESTVHGPVVQREDAANVAYTVQNAMAGHDLGAFIGFIELNRSRDLEDYKRAAAKMVGNFNVNYAGTDGHIATMHAGLLPVRASGVDPRLPTPGTGEYDWQGYTKELAFTIDPEQGYLHVWNNKPTASSTYGDTSRYGKGFRTWLGRSLAESKDKVSREDLHEFHRMIGRSSGGMDLSVTNPRYFTPYLKKAVAGDAKLTAAVTAMDGWNAVYEDKDKDGYYDSPGLTAYRAWIDIAQKQVIGDDIGEWWHQIDDRKYIKYRTDVLLRAIEGSAAATPMKYDWFNGKPSAKVLRKTVADTVAALEKEYSSADPAAWRQRIFYRYYLPSEIAKNPDKPSRRGNGRGPGSAVARLGLQPPYVIDNGSEAWNMLVEVKRDDPTLYDSTPSGGQNLTITADGKGNPNIADQVRLHENFEFKAVSLDRERIVREAVATQRLKLPADLGKN